jgi:hypothetical protein
MSRGANELAMATYRLSYALAGAEVAGQVAFC